VLPFGAVFIYKGKLTFVTNNKKPVWTQLTTNPKVEISAMGPTGNWIRVTGTVKIWGTHESKVDALAAFPMLGGMYKADDGIFEAFYLDSGKASIEDLSGGKDEITF
jgi:uncharacterized pyridoxamine 5'-phosphate oxidase family protein